MYTIHSFTKVKSCTAIFSTMYIFWVWGTSTIYPLNNLQYEYQFLQRPEKKRRGQQSQSWPSWRRWRWHKHEHSQHEAWSCSSWQQTQQGQRVSSWKQWSVHKERRWRGAATRLGPYSVNISFSSPARTVPVVPLNIGHYGYYLLYSLAFPHCACPVNRNASCSSCWRCHNGVSEHVCVLYLWQEDNPSLDDPGRWSTRHYLPFFLS